MTRDLTAVARFILAVGMAGLALACSQQSGLSLGGPTEVSGQRNPGGVGLPCGGDGIILGLDRAEHDMPFGLPVPRDELASRSSMAGVWECSQQSVEMVFSSGIKIYVEPNAIRDPEAARGRLAAQDPANTSVGTVRGEPAALIDPAKDAAHTATGSVTLVDDGLFLTIEGNGTLTIDELIRVTESLEDGGAR